MPYLLSIKTAEKQKASFDSVFEYLYLRIYEFFYMTGILFIRQIRGFCHFVTNEVKYLKEHIIAFARHIWIHIRSSIRNFLIGKYHVLLTYRNQASDAALILSRYKENSFEENSSAVLTFIRCWFVFVIKIICTLFNYIAPIVAAVFLVYTIQYFDDLKYGLALESNGKTIAYINNENTYNEAEQIIRSRTSSELESVINVAPQYSIVPVSSLELTEPEELANIILRSSGANVYEGYGLYIDDEFICSTDEADSILSALDEYREQYRDEGDTESKMQFVQKISLVDGVYPASSIMAMSEFKTLLNTEIEGEKYYTVEAGDAPLSIAAYFGVSYSELCNMNPGLESGDIHVGDKLIVSKSVSILNVTNTKREVYTEEVPYTTNYTKSDNYYVTYSKVTKKGVPGEQEVTALVTYEDGVVVNRQVLTTEIITEPVAREVTIGTKPVLTPNTGTSSSGFIWPTIGGYVSCAFRGYVGHTGMDIAGCGYGSNIYASASGTVVKVKWSNTGYGNYIIIDHGGGIQTLYAHNSNLYVKVGQYVNQGDIIAAMGSSGNSTGTHCHFEIRINGQYVNPAKYVSK